MAFFLQFSKKEKETTGQKMKCLRLQTFLIRNKVMQSMKLVRKKLLVKPVHGKTFPKVM